MLTAVMPDHLGRPYEPLKNAFPAKRSHFGRCFTRLDPDTTGVNAQFACGAGAAGHHTLRAVTCEIATQEIT